MATIAEQFLKTEQAASALLDELGQLRSETKHYSSAASALDDASRSLGELAGKATELVTDVRNVVVAMQEIGTPELLERLERLTARSEEQVGQLQDLRECVQRLTEKVDVLLPAVSAIPDRLATSLGPIESRLDAIAGATEQLLQRPPWWAFWRRQ